MTKNMKVAGLVTAMLAGSSAQAQTSGGFEIGPVIADYEYRERDEGIIVARDKGMMYGLDARYTETLSNGWFVRLRARGLTGEIDYEDDDGERIDDVDQTVGSAELHVGLDLALGSATLTPFVGLAHRSLEDESGGRETQGGLAGYDRTVSYRYVPVGLGLTAPVGAARLRLEGQVNFVAGGSVRSKFSKIDPEFPDIKVGLRGGTGVRLEASAELPLGSTRLIVGPFVEHWRIRRSKETVLSDGDETNAFVEPRNRTTMIGALLRIGF